MDDLTKSQKDEYATAWAALAFYDGGQIEITEEQIKALLDATGNDEVPTYYPMLFAKFVKTNRLAKLIALPVTSGETGTTTTQEVKLGKPPETEPDPFTETDGIDEEPADITGFFEPDGDY